MSDLYIYITVGLLLHNYIQKKGLLFICLWVFPRVFILLNFVVVILHFGEPDASLMWNILCLTLQILTPTEQIGQWWFMLCRLTCVDSTDDWWGEVRWGEVVWGLLTASRAGGGLARSPDALLSGPATNLTFRDFLLLLRWLPVSPPFHGTLAFCLDKSWRTPEQRPGQRSAGDQRESSSSWD